MIYRITVLAFCIFTAICEAKLIPTPFLTEPHDMQRLGWEECNQHMNCHLFSNIYGISIANLRTDSTKWLSMTTDPALSLVVYGLGTDDGVDREGLFLKACPDAPNGYSIFHHPRGICIDTALYYGNQNLTFVYVIDEDNNRIVRLKYDAANEITTVHDDFAENFIYKAKGISCAAKPNGGSYVVVADAGHNRIVIFKMDADGTYELLMTYGSEGTGVGQFSFPQGVSISQIIGQPNNYYIYVTDKHNYRIVCLRFLASSSSIEWVNVYQDPEAKALFRGVTSNKFYCVYVADYENHKIWVFTPELTELLYTFGEEGMETGQFISPCEICIIGNEIAITENWTASTGIQYFRIIPEIREFYPEPSIFDATTDSVKINFRVDETAHYLTLMAFDKAVFHDQYYEPGRDSAYWDGKNADGFLVSPGTYPIKMYCGAHFLAETQVTVKGTEVSGSVSGHWTPAGSPYVLSGSCEVPAGDSLLIDPGVLIMGRNASALLDNGFIKANGIETDSVVFTAHRKLAPPDSVYPGMWSGIGLSNSGSHLEYCKIEYAGAVNTAVSCRASPEIANCAFKWSKGYGIYCDSIDDLPTIENCHFRENNAAPLRISGSYGVRVLWGQISTIDKMGLMNKI